MRKNLGLGKGKGYYNLVPKDHLVHSLSAKGVKSVTLQRASYGKPNVPAFDREYSTEHTSMPVGTIAEWKDFLKGSGVKKVKLIDPIDGNSEIELNAKQFSMYGSKNFKLQFEELENPSDIASHLKHSNVPDSKFNKVQLKKGMDVEMEHTTNRKVAKAIAKTHILENKNYYKRYDPKKNTKEYLMNAKGDWKVIGDGDAFITKDGNNMISIETKQDRDGKNAFLFTAKMYPYRQALNPKWAKKSYKIATGRDYKKIRAKVKEYMNKV